MKRSIYTLTSKNDRYLKQLLGSRKSYSEAYLNEKIAGYFSKGELFVQILDSAAFISNYQSLTHQLKEKEEKLRKQRVYISAFLEPLKTQTILKMESQQLNSLNGEGVNITLCYGHQKVKILDPELIESAYYKTETVTKLNKALVKASLIQGKEVPGATLEKVVSLKVSSF